MKLRKMSKEVIDYECEKIELIMEYIKDSGKHYDDPLKVALAIYSKRHTDISVINEEDD